MNWLKRLFCRHKETEWMVKKPDGGFVCISGERRYLVCKKCGKIVDEYFHRYE